MTYNGSISNINEFDSYLNDMNKDSFFGQINQTVDNNDIKLNENFIVKVDPKNNPTKCKCEPISIVYRISDFIVFLLLFILVALDVFIIFFFTLEFAVSFYSVILMNYAFFVSSIISYAKAPIYKMLSQDIFNSILSFFQVILSSPLIAFYIYYIAKSVKNLGEFISDVPKFSKKVFSLITIRYNHYFMTYLSTILHCKNYKNIFNCQQFIIISAGFGIFLVASLITALLFYILFCIDKCVILIGSFCYIVHTIKIFILVLPSYLYFFQILFNQRCKKYDFVDKFLDRCNCCKVVDDKSINKDIPIHNNFEVSDDKMSVSSDNEISENNNSYVLNIQENDYEISESSKKSSKNNYIGELKSDYERYREIMIELRNMVCDLVSEENYISLYDYSKSIAFDRHNQGYKRFCMIIFLILNLIVIVNDIYQLNQTYSDYLLSSIIVRFLLIPFFSFFNILTTFVHRAQKKSLKYIIYISDVSTIIILIISFLGHSYVKYYQSNYRINDLNYIPPYNNITVANEKMLIHPLCGINLFNVTAFDAFGYALGGYDIKRNITIFDNQMKIFFGENYSSYISYKTYELDKYFLFLKYYDSSINTHIFAFRGYNSGPELAFQFELFVSQYIVPFFEDIVPFYETINDFWLGFYTDFLSAFGLRFFENKNLIVKYVDKIRQIYDNENLEGNERVIFTGINIGGVIAKIVGTLEEHKSISFISFPLMDFLESLFHYPESYISYVTHIFNVDGIFSHIDSDNANNIGIDTPLFYQSKWCTSGFCDIFSRTDHIYRSFCTMSEICGKGNQFNYYCVNTIGEKNLEIIRESLQDEE